jgi:hypothetical protein
MSTAIDSPEFEARFVELEHTRAPIEAWRQLACAVSHALVSAQSVILARQREIVCHPGPLSSVQAAIDDIAARRRLVHRLRALHRVIGSHFRGC